MHSYTSTPPIRLYGVVISNSTGTTLPYTYEIWVTPRQSKGHLQIPFNDAVSKVQVGPSNETSVVRRIDRTNDRSAAAVSWDDGGVWERQQDCMADVLIGFHRSTFSKPNTDSIQISPHAISGLFQPWKGSSGARNFEVINGLQHVFEKWVERCKKCVLRKWDRHRTSTKFRLAVIRWVHELCKQSSYYNEIKGKETYIL
jgi:hypothetical protein